MNRLEALINAATKNEIIENWDSLNRLEKYLVCIMTSKGIEDMGEPMNRLEELLTLCYKEETDEDIMIAELQTIAADYKKVLETTGGSIEDTLSENIIAYNKEGLSNLKEKGITLPENTTTQEIIQSIADIEVSEITEDGAGNAVIMSSKFIDNAGDIILN